MQQLIAVGYWNDEATAVHCITHRSSRIRAGTRHYASGCFTIFDRAAPLSSTWGTPGGDPEAQRLWRRTPEEIESADRDIIAKLIEKHGGLSESTCTWAGCEDLALRGLVFYPACAHDKMNHWP